MVDICTAISIFRALIERYCTVTIFKPFQSWPVNHLGVPIGVSHISLRHKKYNQGSGRKRTKNKRTIWAWVNSSASRLSCDTLHSWCICRLTLACISSEISTSHEERWLILTGLTSLILDPISCQLVSSAVRCRLPTALLPRPSPTASSGFLLLTPLAFPYPLPVTSKIAGSGLCLVSRQNKQKERLLTGPPT